MPWKISTGGQGPAFDTELEYDAFETRLAKRGPSSTTLYAGDLYERLIPSAGATEHRYKVFAGDRLIAQVTKFEQGGALVNQQMRFIHDDHLGSVSVITDESGTLVESRSFDPFGTPAAAFSSASVTSGFTGHEHDGDLGLVNMKGRLYDARLGRFLTPDPFIAEPLNPQGWNRYSYVQNNPVNFVDPSGFCRVVVHGVSGTPSYLKDPLI